jgi:hypothetical protein
MRVGHPRVGLVKHGETTSVQAPVSTKRESSFAELLSIPVLPLAHSAFRADYRRGGAIRLEFFDVRLYEVLILRVILPICVSV